MKWGYVMIDILEEEIMNISEKLFNVLLKDRTTKKNICWATDNYVKHGIEYYPQEPITKKLITGHNAFIIAPRVAKTTEEQVKRTKEKAEVFTPSWLCNEQNNLIDEAWFGKKNIFNKQTEQSWITNKDRIVFPPNKTWRKYVDARRLEISCGEAPYLVSRYDTVTGEEIPVVDRIGLLDRKLRVVNENTVSEDDWFEWTKRAFESTYGYEYQGDNLLIARENLLYTFIENMNFKFGYNPSEEQLLLIAKIISWNLWQMDGLTLSAPFSEREKANKQLTIFDYLDETDAEEKEPIPCKIYDWRANTSLEFQQMVKGGLR